MKIQRDFAWYSSAAVTSGMLLTMSQAAIAGETGQATDDQENYSQEIIVTARSQGEALTKIPVAVTAMEAQDIQRYAAADLIKISQIVPQLEVYNGGAGAGGAFLVRGIGTTADVAGVDQSVSTALDGSQIARPRTAVSSMFDLQQVAILKGPQALFFGKNSSAGVVQIQTANPTGDFSGYLTGGYEFEARETYFTGALNIPLDATLGVRLAGRFTSMRGYVFNTAQSRVDPNGPNFFGRPGEFAPVMLFAPRDRWGPGTKEWAGRITIKWEPTSTYTSVLKATTNKLTDNASTALREPVCEGRYPTHFGVPALESECTLNGITNITNTNSLYAAPDPNSPEAEGPYVPRTVSKSKYFTWQQNLDLGNIHLSSNTGYTTLKFTEIGSTYAAVEFGEMSGKVYEDSKAFSQEIRLRTQFEGNFNGTVGAYYEHARTKNRVDLFLFNLGPDDGGPTPTGSWLTAISGGRARSDAYSLFAQGQWDILPNLELAGGVRYSKTKKNVSQGNPDYVHFLATFTHPRGELLSSRVNEDNWSPEVTLSWNPTNSSTLYAAYKTGYKSGGVAMPNMLSITDTGDSLTFRPEKSRGGEVGYKGDLFDRRLRLAVTAYYYKFIGMQLSSFSPVLSSYQIQNAADAKQKGVEAEATYRMFDGLTLRASANYSSVKYGAFETSACYANQTATEGCVNSVQDLSGRQLHRAPKFSATAGFSYERLVSNDLMLGLDADLRYRSGTYTLETQSPLSWQKANALINAGVRLFSEDKSKEVALIGRNLTNKRLIGFIQDRPGALVPGLNEAAIYGTRPREIALQGTIRF